MDRTLQRNACRQVNSPKCQHTMEAMQKQLPSTSRGIKAPQSNQ